MQINDQLRDDLWYLLARLGDGYIELSHDKVHSEYIDFKKQGKRLYHEFCQAMRDADESKCSTD
jgi:hypothetical protein